MLFVKSEGRGGDRPLITYIPCIHTHTFLYLLHMCFIRRKGYKRVREREGLIEKKREFPKRERERETKLHRNPCVFGC